MFKYIDMPKLVAFFLREFSYRKDGTTSTLYKFVFCLCLPFVSYTFRRARLIALAIAQCTNSRDQITRVLESITGVTVSYVSLDETYYLSYNGVGNKAEIPYNTLSKPLMPYSMTANSLYMYIQLNGASETEVRKYLQLLVPFYIKLEVKFNETPPSFTN